MLIREMSPREYPLLEDFLYEAIFIPKGVEKPPREIIEQDELQIYIRDFGKLKDDCCLVAECCGKTELAAAAAEQPTRCRLPKAAGGKIVGACWVRIMNDYGHIDDETPSFAISLYKEYRGHGIGTELMQRMLELLRAKGYKRASLAVQKENYAVNMYRNVGFEVCDENDSEYIMLCRLNK